MVAYGVCGHREVCSTCVVRLRFICQDRRCSTVQGKCLESMWNKNMNPRIVITRCVSSVSVTSVGSLSRVRLSRQPKEDRF
ncbi:hypothetical protein LINPERPRIM_LOCUS2039 [Linum perenne]